MSRGIAPIDVNVYAEHESFDEAAEFHPKENGPALQLRRHRQPD
ncbi:hypothetical protein [Mesorhizobium xinjiangense]|nr:hypothetical protein [Mesorhizobium xinjiangense]